MVETIKRIARGVEFTFYCEAYDTRNGFAHRCDVYMNGERIASNKSFYLNRTWESYKYQSVMRGAIYGAMNVARDDIKARFKESHGYKRMTEARERELEKVYEENEYLKTLEELLRIVTESRYGTEEEREQLESMDALLKLVEACSAIGMFKHN